MKKFKILFLFIVIQTILFAKILVEEKIEFITDNEFTKNLQTKSIEEYTIVLEDVKASKIKSGVARYFLDEQYGVIKYKNKFYVIYKSFAKKSDAIKEQKNMYPPMVEQFKVIPLYYFIENNKALLEKIKKEKENKDQHIIDKYKSALLSYKAKNYEDSYNKLNTLFEQNLNNVNINLYLGRSAYNLKKYEEAILAYERVLFENPNDSKVKFELARCYAQSNQLGEAKKLLQEILADKNISQQLQNVSTKLYQGIINKEEKNFVSGAFVFGLNYDTNVNQASLPYDLTISGLGTSSQNPKEQSGSAHQEILVLNQKYKLADNQFFKNDFLVFKKTYYNNNLTDNNLHMISYTPSISEKYTDGVEVTLGLFVDSLWIDSVKTLTSSGFLYKLAYLNKENIFYDGYMKYQNKNYQKPSDMALQKDSKVFELGMSMKKTLQEGQSYGLAFVLNSENKISGTQTDIDKTAYSLKFDTLYPVSKELFLAPMFSYKNTLYRESAVSSDGVSKRREDNEYKAALSSTYLISSKFLAQVIVDKTKVDSNNDTYSYEKKTMTLNLVRPF